MTRTQLQYSLEEIGARAQAVYNENLRAHVETDENIGRFITIDVLTGDYEVGEDHVETALRLRARQAEAVTCTLRIGYPATFSHGIRMKPRTK